VQAFPPAAGEIAASEVVELVGQSALSLFALRRETGDDGRLNRDAGLEDQFARDVEVPHSTGEMHQFAQPHPDVTGFPFGEQGSEHSQRLGKPPDGDAQIVYCLMVHLFPRATHFEGKPAEAARDLVDRIIPNRLGAAHLAATPA
jgi:hypothetical protein